MKGKGFVAFVAGAAVGAAVSWYYLKTYYEKLAQEEIDSVKEVFSRRNDDKSEETSESLKGKELGEKFAEGLKEGIESVSKNLEKPNIMEYAAKLQKEGYTDYSGVSEDKEEPKPEPKMTVGIPGEIPYVIAPEEYGEMDGYEEIELTYFADEVLVDDDFNVVDNIDDIVGYESLTSFDEYEDDAVYVRNDRLRIDYSILREERTYADYLRDHPYKVGM